MKSLRWIPQELIGRVTLVLVCAVLLEFLGSFLFYERQEIHATREAEARHLAGHLVTAARVLQRTPAVDRPSLAGILSSQTVKVEWSFQSPGPVTTPSAALGSLRPIMADAEPTLGGAGDRFRLVATTGVVRPDIVVAALQLSDGSWVHAAAEFHMNLFALLLRDGAFAVVMCAAVSLAAVLLVRAVGAPLHVLADAADGVGKGGMVHVPEAGASDVRRVARAFNAMQQRIADLIAARTQALAAVSHDLRTPLSRLRLRAGAVADEETRCALERDLEEMSAMLDSLLAYLGGRHEMEAQRLTDVAAICLTLVDAACDAGSAAIYSGPDQLMLKVRPLAFKRAADNLIQNAVTYGGRADVSLNVEGSVCVLAVEDDGPGIPENQISKVTEAFHRLDEARARNTAGLGLGLNIVQRIAAAEGGELKLRNRAGGGFRAELILPLAG